MSRAEILRSRLLAVLGAGSLYALGSTSAADTGPPTETTLCFAAQSETCPAREDAIGLLNDANADDCPVQSVDSDGVYADGSCCYDVTLSWCSPDTGDDFTKCGCYGRPFVHEGHALLARSVPERRWASGPEPDLTGLSPAERAALARKWTADGLAEHSSVAGFARFALDLMAHGAPPELVQRALLAGAQETGHARMCFALAAAFAGAPVGPSALPLGGAAPLSCDLIELAVSTAREGALGETLAAFMAAEALSFATDPAVRQVLARVVEEETQHAELAWATLRWAIEVGGAPVRHAVAEALAEPLEELTDEGPGVPSHGLLDRATRRAARAQGMRRIITPAVAALLGQAMEVGLGV